LDILNNVAKSLAHAVAKKHEESVSAHGLSLGAGRLFGDLALVQQAPQGFSASCKEDCELFVIEKPEFEQVLKEDLQRITCEKLDLLKKYLPGMHTISPQMAEPLLHCFQKKVFSKSHVICSQNAAAKKSIYLVSKGSVFLSSTNASTELRGMGSLVKGGVFGCLDDTSIQPCTVSCTSSCELFVASGRYLQALPPSVRRSTQKYLCQTFEWSGGSACSSPHQSSSDNQKEEEHMSRRSSDSFLKKSPSLSGLHKNEEAHMSRRSSDSFTKKSSSLSGLLAQRAHGQLNQATGDHKRDLEPMSNFPTITNRRSSEPQLKRSVSSSAMPAQKAQPQLSPDRKSHMVRALKRNSSLPSLSRTI
jgi:CRP-like cAMP-binding protein